ncbi:MAG: UMP kinase, partial [Candidatus Aenigmarchaeota archaeon]|nr:UMP kinase [Candidatus Aenigmarchaeota archaeon]
MQKNVVVMSLGGSVIFSDNSRHFILELPDFIFRHQNLKFLIVVGGGYPARLYIDTANKLGLSEYEQDRLGIKVTNLN